jgi:metallophosphoesterase (TIGR03768 family)
MGTIDGSTPFGTIIGAGPVTAFTSPPTIEADPNRRPLTRAEWITEFSNTSSSPSGHGFNLVDPGQAAGFGCYSFVPKSAIPLKVIVLDDTQTENDSSSDIHGHGFLDQARWDWLKKELASGEASGQLMIIAAHIPISVEASSSQVGWWTDTQNAVSLEGLVNELQSHPNLIMWLAGHRHMNTVKAFVSPDPAHPENGFWQVETSSLRDFPQQFRTFEIDLNSDYTLSIVTTDVDPAVKDGSLAATSRKYAIAAMQIVKAWSQVTNWNPTSDPTIKPMPTGSYNAELLKQLSPSMITKMKGLYPTI